MWIGNFYIASPLLLCTVLFKWSNRMKKMPYQLETLLHGQVRPNPDQPRKYFPEEQLLTIANSLRTQGQLVPIIVVRMSGYHEIVDGEFRWRGLKEINASHVQAVVWEQRPSPVELLQTQLMVNCHRSDLNPLDKARAYVKLLEELPATQQELAKLLHVSPATVSNTLKLLELRADLQALVQRGDLNPSLALELRHADEAELPALLANQSQLTRAQVQQRRKPATAATSSLNRVSLPLAAGTLSVNATNDLDMSVLIELLQTLLKEARTCRSEGYNLGTFSRMLADRHAAAVSVKE
jgi:ParB/RepB/Spo0J family partition protein